MSSMKITNEAIDSLIPYIRNARTHSEEQVAQIAGSIREFGFTNPVLIDGEGGIIAGHGRVMAARKLGMDDVPCIRLGHLTEAQRRAYVIADNKLALNAGWDTDMLSVEFADLLAMGADLELTGFEQDEIDEIMTYLDDYLGDADEDAAQSGAGSLAGRFMVPPFSVLNAREGWWQDRKRAWLALGIKSELGRGGGLTIKAEPVTAENLNFYRNRQRQAAAPGPRVTTPTNSAAMAQEGR